jgi:hypothetical protein
MMRKRGRRASVVVVLAACMGAFGCELALDFDRTKIDGGGIDASFSDGPSPFDQSANEAANDTGGGDGPSADAPADAPVDARADGGSDAPADAAADAEDSG